MTNGFSEHASPEWPISETSADRADRIRREAELIVQAEADIDAGLGIDEEDIEAWLDALEIDPTTPLPSPKTPRRP